PDEGYAPDGRRPLPWLLRPRPDVCPAGCDPSVPPAEELPVMTSAADLPEGFSEGLEGVTAFTTEIAEPDREGGALRYRGVDIEDLVGNHITFGDAWSLLVDGEFGRGLPPAEPFPRPIHTGNVRVDVQARLAMLAPIWGLEPLADLGAEGARGPLARSSVMALSYCTPS